MVVILLVEGFINEDIILEVIPPIINRNLAGPITQLNECTFIVPLASRVEVKEVSKLGSFKAATKDGPCTLKVSPWLEELGADRRVFGEG